MIQRLSLVGEIKTIHSTWYIPIASEENPEALTRNTEQFFAAIEAGKSLREAAESTFTGQLANMYGFTFQSAQKINRFGADFVSVRFVRE
jgi:hypothetical protein